LLKANLPLPDTLKDKWINEICQEQHPQDPPQKWTTDEAVFGRPKSFAIGISQIGH